MPLTHISVKNAKPKEKTYRLFDERGLYLEVSPSGGKWWRFKYRFEGKEKRISLGTYPDISLKEARDRRHEVRNQVANGIDPSVKRKAEKDARAEAGVNSFEVVAREWFSKFSKNWGDSHGQRVMRRFEKDIFPWLGKVPIADIKAPELLIVIQKIESRGALETAHRALQTCGQVFRYAIVTGRGERDVALDLKGSLPAVAEKHHPSITDPKKIGELLRIIETYEGSQITRCALKLAALTFVRPGELRRAEWSEIDFEASEWRIPPERMKRKRKHIVPLSKQAKDVLRELEPLTGRWKYLFPGLRTTSRPMSENTVNAALRRMGYSKEEMTGHGFRSMASTILNEEQWHFDAIERQLAHADKNAVRAAYNHADYLPERDKMMQWWADYLDGLRVGLGSNQNE